MLKSDHRLIVALDMDNMDKVRSMVDMLGDTVTYYKIGMELFYSKGTTVIEFLKRQGKDIFLDLKLHDIPNTVAKSACVLTELGVSMFNVHAPGGIMMMKTARDAVAERAHQLGIPKPLLIGVTVLTSINEQEWRILHCTNSIGQQALELAKNTQEAGLDGVVASPREATMIRAACGPDFNIVTPGIRPSGAAVNDQNRIATPADALKMGASYLVVGRPITAAKDPKLAAQNIVKEMRGL